jgi:hypothetical protein
MGTTTTKGQNRGRAPVPVDAGPSARETRSEHERLTRLPFRNAPDLSLRTFNGYLRPPPLPLCDVF